MQYRCLIALRTRPQTQNTPLGCRYFYKKVDLSWEKLNVRVQKSSNIWFHRLFFKHFK
eukprot:UN10881